MNRVVVVAAAALLSFFAACIAIVAWITRDEPVGAQDVEDVPRAAILASSSGRSAALSTRPAAASPTGPSPVAGLQERASAMDDAQRSVPARDGERILDELERALIASEAARRCVAEGPPEGAAVRLAVDPSGVTYRFSEGADPAVRHCLMMQAMPDVVATVSAPAGVRRAERTVQIPDG